MSQSLEKRLEDTYAIIIAVETALKNYIDPQTEEDFKTAAELFAIRQSLADINFAVYDKLINLPKWWIFSVLTHL